MHVNEYEILIASPFDRDYLVAEIYHKLLFAEINQEQGYLEIQIYPTSVQKIVVNLNNFIEVLDVARKYLNANVNIVSTGNIVLKRKSSNGIYLFDNNRNFAIISNGSLEISIQSGKCLKLPLEDFLKKLRCCVVR